MKVWEDFKKFAFKGNVIDMAVGVVIGSAFGAIVSSLVNDIIMPLLGLLTGGVSFSDLKVVLVPAVLDEAGNVLQAENALAYGSLLQKIIDFLLIALSLFIIVKAVAKASEARQKLEEKLHAEEIAKKRPRRRPQQPLPPQSRPLPPPRSCSDRFWKSSKRNKPHFCSLS